MGGLVVQEQHLGVVVQEEQEQMLQKKKKRQIFELGDDQSNPGSDRKTYPIKQEKMFTL